MFKKVLALLKASKESSEVSVVFYNEDKRGYQKLYDEDEVLYDICRSYLLSYAQEWDDEAHKQEELKHILSFSYIPFSIPKNRELKLLKRGFKRALNKIDCKLDAQDDGYKIAVVKIANTLLEFRQKSKTLRNKIKK